MLGATNYLITNSIGTKISIHAPMLGATLKAHRVHSHYNNFNPRPYVRSDAARQYYTNTGNGFQSTPLC